MESANRDTTESKKFTVRRDARRSGRFTCEDLRSSLGKVIDLSSEGCRVIYRGFTRIPVGYAIQLTLEGYDNSITVEAEIKRTDRRGFLTTEVGLKFIRLSQADHDRITTMARNHSKRYHVIRDAIRDSA
jgi:PilZ domain-containing protein